MINFYRSVFLFVLLIGFIPAFSQSAKYVPDELLIQFKAESSPNLLLRSLESDHQIVTLNVTLLSDIMNIYQIQFHTNQNDLNTIERICKNHSEVLVVQKNHYIYERETIPSDTLFNDLWHLKNTGQTGGVVDADIDAPEAWDITTGGLTTHGDTIVVCIIEGSGVDINHVDLIDNIWKNHGEIPNDGMDNDNNGYIDDYDGWNVISNNDAIGAGPHGTRVAGMIGAKGNNITGISGVNWDVKMMVVQGQNATNEASVIAAYNYPLKMRKMYNASQGLEGAFVVATNSSWGINNESADGHPLWCAMYDSLGHYGILNIAATTNNNNNVDVVGDMPTTCVSEFLVAVTMTNSQDIRANSGYGATHVDLGAPGNSVKLTSPGNSYSTVSGTSFATPNVVGCVALAYSTPCAEFINFVKYNPSQAALAMREYILTSVDIVPSLMTDVSSGGRMNIKNTIDSILANCDPSSCIPPYNLLSNNISDTSVSITWQGFSSDYIVYLQEGNSTPIEIGMPSANSISFDTLIPCTWYTLTIKADCGTDSSNFSFPLIFQTDGCCSNPSLVLDSKTEASMTLSWNTILYASQYDVRYKPSNETVWTELLNVSSPYTFTGLSGCTNYDFQIHTICTDSSQGYSSTQQFVTLGCGACTEKTYCGVSGANSNTEWIQSISINGFSNSTGQNSGWFQSEQIITALTPGQNYPIVLTPGYSGFNFTERFSIWIDFNMDGVFQISEAVLTDQSTNTFFVGSIAIPLASPVGITKMRIGMSSLAPPDICPTAAFFGEYEDYCVYIGGQVGLDENQNHFLVYPNPVIDELFIKSADDILEIRIFSSDGKVAIQQEHIYNSSVSTADLTRGLYFIEIKTNSGIYKTKFVKN